MVPPPALPPARSWLDARAAALARALFPRVMEYKVISREREKHEFMPVVYVIDRSANWKQRVPSFIERAIVQAYITPVVVGDDTAGSGSTARAHKLARLAHELHQRTQLMDVAATGVCTDEARYKLGVFVDYARGARAHEPSDLHGVVRAIATTLRAAAHQRALVVPVSMHFCSSGSVVNANRFAGVRYGAPVLLEARDAATFAQDPTEFVQHVSARLSASLKMAPPSTATQMEILRLSRTLHVYCAQVFRDDCFSRRQIASMNEELLQIHFRTRSHPDMHVLKDKMATYVRILRKWRLRDEDINAAAIEPHTASHRGLLLAWLALQVLQRALAAPGQLLLSGACDLVYAPQRKHIAAPAMLAAVVKCALALVALGVLVRLVQSRTVLCVLVALAALLAVLHATKDALDVAQHLKKLQFYLMDAAELQELTETRAVLARRIHGLVAHYLSTDLPQPVLQDRTKAASDDTLLPAADEYALNAHHKIFINAPRSYPLASLSAIRDVAVARRVVFAPKMLRDETWRTIYESLAPRHLRLRALLASNKGDNLPMDELLRTPLFSAVLSAYIVYQARQQQRATTASDDEKDADVAADTNAIDWSALTHHTTDNCAIAAPDAYGDLGSADAVIDAALQLAQEEDELSS